MNINELPLEMLEKVFSYLTIEEKFRSERVCRLWQSIVFLSIDKLAFEGFHDEFCHSHEHTISKQILPFKVNNDTTAMNHIISKCGKNLRSFQGIVSLDVMKIIAEKCGRLHCVGMRVDTKESLDLLGSTFGKQLTCVALYTNLGSGIITKKNLSFCENLKRFALICPSGDSLDLFDLNDQSPILPQSFASIRSLILKTFVWHERTLRRLALFINLDMASIVMDHEVNKSILWKQVMTSWSSLQSLFLNVSNENCIEFEPLPPNLESLSLIANGHNNCDYATSNVIKFSNVLPRLKRLKIYQFGMTPVHLSAILESIVSCCPALEEFSLRFHKGLNGNTDELLAPLLTLTTLKQLFLGSEFQITDTFASKLITDLDLLTTLGQHISSEFYYFENRKMMIPCGPLFWEKLKEKAISRPAESFKLIGACKDQLYLQEPLPPNLSLYVKGSAEVKVTNGFSRSSQWQELVDRSALLRLKMEIQDTNFEVNGLPKHVDRLSVRCLKSNSVECEEIIPFTFKTLMSKLEEFYFYQEYMSNRQLQTTLRCISEFCPNLKTFCFDRGNRDQGPADDFVIDILKCRCLRQLCFTENIVINEEIGVKFVNDVPDLRIFGCHDDHRIGFVCGPLMIEALSSKATKRRKRIVLNGALSREEVAKLTNLSRNLVIKPFEIHTPVKTEDAKEDCAEDL